MNGNLGFEQFLAEQIVRAGSGTPPRDAVDQILNEASQIRPRPRWLALIKEPPMRFSSSLAVGSPAVRVFAVMLATLLVALAVAGAGVAGSRLLAANYTFVVDPGGSGDFTTIAEAVAEARDGDSILVKPGLYDESILLTEDITIRGEERDGVIVEVSAELGHPAAHPDNDFDPTLPTAFVFDGSDARLESLTVRGDSSRILVKGGSPVLSDLRLAGLGRHCCEGASSFEPTGLVFTDASTARLEDSLIHDMDTVFVHSAAPSVVGNEFSGGNIWMQGEGVDPLISDNIITGITDIAVWGGARPTISGNAMTDVPGGIGIEDEGWEIPDTGSRPIITGNTITGTALAAITVMRGAGATIEDNVFDDNGVGISLSSEAHVKGNRLSDGGTGIVINVGAASITDNTIEGMTVAGISVSFAGSPTLRGNSLCDNTQNLRIVDGATPDVDASNTVCEDAPAG